MKRSIILGSPNHGKLHRLFSIAPGNKQQDGSISLFFSNILSHRRGNVKFLLDYNISNQTKRFIGSSSSNCRGVKESMLRTTRNSKILTRNRDRSRGTRSTVCSCFRTRWETGKNSEMGESLKNGNYTYFSTDSQERIFISPDEEQIFTFKENAEEKKRQKSSTKRPEKWKDNPNILRMTAKELLDMKQKKVVQVHIDATLDEAIASLVHNRSSSALVYEYLGDNNSDNDSSGTKQMSEKDKLVAQGHKKAIVGIFTARDILKKLNAVDNKLEALTCRVRDIRVPMSKVIYCSPSDKLKTIQYLMANAKIRNIPILENGVIIGLITVEDLSDVSFTTEEIGGKKAFISNVSGKIGLPKGTSVAPHSGQSYRRKLKIAVAIHSLPHPFKTEKGIGANHRDYGAHELATDPDLSEDSSFIVTKSSSGNSDTRESENYTNVMDGSTSDLKEITYVGIADGVGSWRAYGVDPRNYSRALMKCCEEFITSQDNDSLRPLDILTAGWSNVTESKIVGSSTICVGTLDASLNQFTFSNVGDNGIIILRHIDSDVAGYMRDRHLPRPLRESDLRIAFVSRQQLRSFNLPYQLGYTNEFDMTDEIGQNTGQNTLYSNSKTNLPGNRGLRARFDSLSDPSELMNPDNRGATEFFETPSDADTSSIPVMSGDIIIMATDGLWDNIELDDIVKLVREWEMKWYKGEAKGVHEDQYPAGALEELSKLLCEKSREYSLDKKRDSPFALLAKDNDVLWPGGGMPDDVTVASIQVMKRKKI